MHRVVLRDNLGRVVIKIKIDDRRDGKLTAKRKIRPV
jgi:uncharacterized protein YqgV (UPF0045/DUF77 family)